jgi:hypothetical protein
MARRIPQNNYFADIRAPDGSSCWTHVRTSFDRSTAYAIIAKHYAGWKIEDFRDDRTANAYDRLWSSSRLDGTLRKPESSLTGNESRYYGPF